MSLPHSPAWPLCSLSLFSSPSPRLLPSPPPRPPCWHFPFPACAGVWEAPSNPLRFLLAVSILPKSPLPSPPKRGKELLAPPGSWSCSFPPLQDPPGRLLPGEFAGLGVQSSLWGQEMGEVLGSCPSHPLLHVLCCCCSSFPPCLLSSDPGAPLGPLHHRPDPTGDSSASWDGRLWEGRGASPLPCENPSPGVPAPVPTHPGGNLGTRKSHAGGARGSRRRQRRAGSERFILYMNDF